MTDSRIRFNPEWWIHIDPCWTAEAHLTWHTDWPWWKKHLVKALSLAIRFLTKGYRP